MQQEIGACYTLRPLGGLLCSADADLDLVGAAVSEVAAEHAHGLEDGSVLVSALETVSAAGDEIAASGAQDRDVVGVAGHGVALLFSPF